MKLWKLSRWLLFHMYGEINYWFWINACFFRKDFKRNLQDSIQMPDTRHLQRAIWMFISFPKLPVTCDVDWLPKPPVCCCSLPTCWEVLVFTVAKRKQGSHMWGATVPFTGVRPPEELLNAFLRGSTQSRSCESQTIHTDIIFFINSTEGSIQVKLCSEWLD